MTSALLLENIHDTAVERFKEAQVTVERRTGALAGDELHRAPAAHQILGIRSATHLGAAEIEAAKHLVAIGCFCIGTSQVDLDAAARAGMPVFNAPFSNTRSVAELVIAEAILLLRRVPEKNTLAHAGKWAKGASGSFEARGKTIAIIGYGNIGSQVGVLAEAMGMRVVYYDVQAKLSLGSARAARSLADAVSQADIVTLHVPATAQTKKMIDADVLRQFRRGAIHLDAAYRRQHGRGAGEYRHGSRYQADRLPQDGRHDWRGEFPRGEPWPANVAGAAAQRARQRAGALAALNTLLARDGVNIVSQHLQTHGQMGYVVTDLDKVPSPALAAALDAETSFIRCRTILNPLA
ncbi:D-3-phosphoglycerate dehydrogenase [Cupriavidus basilensis OR16]|uniref:D-3-phosphoglycerate dehydrogenase n=1 Tax=Cupriavidus basilensis OR16 TaxID=1127483 RepID=H1RZJ0_9BURK|nr:NAD(P)-dependent oxidoreductase [Cupriavidus basilensis]EHP44332.1 D-3-phosphoglycerate dehydrogenase [Cupriavidus basilensis OR16]